MKTITLNKKPNWEKIEWRGQVINRSDALSEKVKERLQSMDFVDLGNGLLVEETTYQVVYIPMEETKNRINELSESQRSKLSGFFRNLIPREGQPTHSDLWSQTYDFINEEFLELKSDTTQLVELYERGDFALFIKNNRFIVNEDILEIPQEEPEMEM